MMGRRFMLLCCVACLASPIHAQGVDIELVLAVDSSGSIDGEEFELQRIGYASARSHELACYKHLPPEKAHFIIAGAELEESLALKPQAHLGFHIGRCGGLEPAKCPPDLVRIFDRIDIPGVRFTVAGPGPLLQPMRQEASNSMPGRYHFPGYLPNTNPLLAQLDVYCYQLPGHSYAASELNIQEAMAAGLPVVFLPSRGCRDLVQHDVTGLVVHSEDELIAACERLYREPELRKRLGSEARNYAARFFGCHNTALGYHRLYAEVMDLHQPPVLATARKALVGARTPRPARY